jgi:hypothetical protein
MKMGTKSLLIGAHQFVIHPLTVFLAWHKLYGHWPNWKELICIAVHDWGYWGCSNMEGVEGQRHPVRGAVIAERWLDRNSCATPHRDLVMYHSRSHANACGYFPSHLCWADKLCVIYDPWWLYLPRVILSGEIREYRAEATKAGLITEDMSNREWYEWARERMVRKAYAQDARPPYTEGS